MKSHPINPYCGSILIVVATLFPVCFPSESIADSLDELRTLSVDQVRERIASSLERLAEKTESGIFSFDFTSTGDRSATPKEDMYPTGANGKGRLVTSRTQGYATHDLNPVLVTKSVSDEGKGKTYFYQNGRLVQVTVDCKPAYLEPCFRFLFSSIQASCWDVEEKDSILKSFPYIVREIDYEGIQSVEPWGEVCVFVSNTTSSRAQKEHRWYFGVFEEQWVCVGDTSIIRSHQPAIGDWPAVDTVTSWKTSLEYQKVQDFVIPKSQKKAIVVEQFDATLIPVSEPRILESSEQRVTSFKILKEFPADALSIPISSDTKIIDNCKEQQQRAIAEDIKKPKAIFNWWLFVGGSLLCAIALAAWKYNHGKKSR